MQEEKKNPSLEKAKDLFDFLFKENYFVICFKSAIVAIGSCAPKT